MWSTRKEVFDDIAPGSGVVGWQRHRPLWSARWVARCRSTTRRSGVLPKMLSRECSRATSGADPPSIGHPAQMRVDLRVVAPGIAHGVVSPVRCRAQPIASTSRCVASFDASDIGGRRVAVGIPEFMSRLRRPPVPSQWSPAHSLHPRRSRAGSRRRGETFACLPQLLLVLPVPKLARDLRPALEEGAGHAAGVVAAGEPDGGVGSVVQGPWSLLLELPPRVG